MIEHLQTCAVKEAFELEPACNCRRDEYRRALATLRGLVDSFKDFSEYGVCCFVVYAAASRVCGEPAHWIEFRESGRLLYCDAHVEQRPDPMWLQRLPHGTALLEAQRLLKEVDGA